MGQGGRGGRGEGCKIEGEGGQKEDEGGGKRRETKRQGEGREPRDGGGHGGGGRGYDRVLKERDLRGAYCERGGKPVMGKMRK